MRTIIYDLDESDIKKINFNKNDKIISALNCDKNCIGCFSCWIKHPKRCVLKDEFADIVENLKNSDELILISKCRYGCYSYQVKKIFERCIGYVLPFFTIRNKEIHHQNRYEERIKLSAYFYGNIDNEDKKCIEKLVKANAINLNASEFKINYIKDLKELEICIH